MEGMLNGDKGPSKRAIGKARGCSVDGDKAKNWKRAGRELQRRPYMAGLARARTSRSDIVLL